MEAVGGVGDAHFQAIQRTLDNLATPVAKKKKTVGDRR